MKFKLFTVFIFLTSFVFSQKTKLQGIVKDAITNEPIVGAIVQYTEGKAVTTDLDGMYSVTLDSGIYTIKGSYIGYKLIEKKIIAKGKSIQLDFPLATNELTEIEVVADIAIQRETPVAFSNIDAKKIQEELGSKDLPLILNNTPGVYATSQGGGDGDARITIRGFSSQNVLVLLDGIPMNDMANGNVYWSNWFGLDNLTRGVQVQRGLGASKLAIPAIGGSMNILTAGIDSKGSIVLKNEYGNNNNYRLGLSYSSGRLKNGWAFNFAGSYKRNDGWFDNMFSRMWFYYGKVEKKIGAHMISISALGAPQTSAQRDFRIAQGIGDFNKDYAYDLGIDTTGQTVLPWRYNPSWNFLTRTAEGETTPNVINTSINKFHKPVFSIKDFISVNEKLNISMIGYASFGRGYGTELRNGTSLIEAANGRQDLQAVYEQNVDKRNSANPFTYERDENNMKVDSGVLGQTWIRKNHNDHNWFGALFTANYKINPIFNLSAGFDGRLYRGFQYSTVDELFSADVVKGGVRGYENPTKLQRKGDKTFKDLESQIRWAGGFIMLEAKKNKWAGFINISSSISWYKQLNHFLKKQIVMTDTILEIGFVPVKYNGVTYDLNSEGIRTHQTDWKRLVGYTIKGGANYNLNDKMNVFLNAGYLNRAPLITFVFNQSNKEYTNVQNEIIKSLELGYSYNSSNFKGNINTYYTHWQNKPYNTTVKDPAGNDVNTNVTGMTARHMGLEFDCVYKVLKNLSLEGMANIADWQWISKAYVSLTDDQGNVYKEITVDPRGIKVSDAAQMTYAASIRYEPIKKLYIKPQFNFFGKNYARVALTEYEESYIPSHIKPNGVVVPQSFVPNKNPGRQPWRMPDYCILDINAGYSFNVWRIKLDTRVSIMNVLNNFYISDAVNNNLGSNFNAASSSVYVGMGRRWQFSLVATF